MTARGEKSRTCAERCAATEPVVVVTGASAGVGRATAEAFARRGARLGLLAPGESRLTDTVGAEKRLGGAAVAIPTDVSDEGAVDEAATRVEAEFGPIDVWVNNAMATIFARLLEVTPEEYPRATEVT